MRIQAGNGIYEMDISRDRYASRTALAATPAEAWGALPAAYLSLGVPGGAVINSTERVFGIPAPVVAPRRIGGRMLSQFLSCGTGSTGPKADTYEVRFQVVSQIDSTSEGAALVTRVAASARPHGIQAQPIECATHGRLELLLADSLAARIRPRPPTPDSHDRTRTRPPM